MQATLEIPLKKIDNFRWEIPKDFQPGMRVPGRIFCDEKLLETVRKDQALLQVANVAHLPGIVKYSLAMPDIHWGYGFPIGGVAATDPEKDGVISPGGIGFDINCGVRLVRTNLTVQEVQPKIKTLVATLFNEIPCGVGQSGEIRISNAERAKVVTQGAKFVVKKGYGVEEDLQYTEASGLLEGADPDAVSERAHQRGRDQLGTLGSGNHFLEVQVIDQIFDTEAAARFGLSEGQVTVMIHSGSRGFGYQICDDFLEEMRRSLTKYHIQVPDIQLACAPVHSPEGKRYISAMRGAANYAWANRQCLMHLARSVFEKVFQKSWSQMGLNLIYDVAHNIAKFEKHQVDGKEKLLCIHRKGATRAFGPGHPELPEAYRDLGQPVVIPGDMGRNSYLLLGTSQALDETFGTTCHGAGRVMSRAQAVREARGRSIQEELEKQGVVVMARGYKGIAEEQPAAYKNVNDVVRVVHEAGIAKRVVRMRPLGVIKG
ncbi:MAG: RtcB family protein [Candidatus Omnitrophica bacterium]|nr:RtcB family protein [Candidatus Omnitrophota bacterium]